MIQDYVKHSYEILEFEHQTPGFLSTWEKYYGNTPKFCPRTDSLCQEVLLEYVDCKCHLTYNIAKLRIDLGLYKPIELKFRDKPLILYSQLLLDFGFLYQVIIRDPNHIDAIGRKLASTILSLTTMEKRFVVAYIT